jgi:cyanate permease
MMRDRKVRLLLAMAIGIFTLDHGLRNWLPEILRTQGWSAAEAGYLATVPVVFGVVSALVFPGRATPERRIGVLQTLFGLAACGYLLLQTPFAATQLPGLVMVGLAAGSMMAICLLALIEQDAVSPARAGLAGGLFFAFAEIGGVGGPVIIGVLHDLTHGFGVSLVLLMLCAAGLILAAGRLRDR